MSTGRRVLIRHILYFATAFAYVCAAGLLGMGCPSRLLLKIPCPACGGTRAMLALLRLDINAYLYYHPLALPTGAAVWCVLHRNLFRKKSGLLTVAFAVLLANLVFYFWRLANGTIP